MPPAASTRSTSCSSRRASKRWWRARTGLRARRSPSAAQRPELERLELRALFEEVELPLVEVLCRMERQGVKLDVAQLGRLAATVTGEVEQLERDIYELAGEEFTVGS